MNIGLFADCYRPTVSGVVTSLIQLKEGLEQRGHRVIVFAVTTPQHDEEDGAVRFFPSIPFNRASGFRLGLVNQRAVNRLVQEENLDLIHTHTEYSLGWAGRRAAGRIGLPFIHTAHTLHEAYRHYLPFGDRLPLRLLRGYLRVFTSRCNKLVCPSRKAERYFRALAPTLATEVIPNGIDRSRFRPRPLTRGEKMQVRSELDIDALDRVVLFAGRLGREKRVMPLLDALAPLLREKPRLKTLIVGSGPCHERVRQSVRERGCAGRVQFAGTVPWARIHRFYAVADVFVTVSLSEIHPMTLIEAAACGLPIVARRDESVEGLVRDGHNGYLVDSDPQIAERLARILDDEARRSIFSQNSLAVSEKFTAEAHVERLEALYRQVTN